MQPVFFFFTISFDSQVFSPCLAIEKASTYNMVWVLCTSQLCTSQWLFKTKQEIFSCTFVTWAVDVYASHMWYSLLQRPEGVLRKALIFFFFFFFEGAGFECPGEVQRDTVSILRNSLLSDDHFLIIWISFYLKLLKKGSVPLIQTTFDWYSR